MHVIVQRLHPDDALGARDALSSILIACVAEGAGLGFAPPLALDEASRYWDGVARDVAAGTRVVLAARGDAGDLIGSAQLDLCQRSNGLHRAELQKVMVAPSARCAGVGAALMRAVVEAARAEGRTTLYLDTFAHQGARKLYERCGWQHAGDIPAFSTDEHGTPRATSLYYKLLSA